MTSAIKISLPKTSTRTLERPTRLPEELTSCALDLKDHVANEMGRVIDRSRNLAKSGTVE